MARLCKGNSHRSSKLKVQRSIYASTLPELRPFMPVRLKIGVLGAVLIGLAGFNVRAAHTQARLPVAAETALPGETVWVGVYLQMDRGWHTYWRNAGAAGLPTSIEWQLPAGVTAGSIHWPVPEKLSEQGLTTYIYTNEVILLVPLKLAANLPPGPFELKAKIAWLECQLECIKADAEVKARLAVGPEAKPSSDARLLETWQKKLPEEGNRLAAVAWWERPAKGDARPLILEWSSTNRVAEAEFFSGATEQFAGETE